MEQGGDFELLHGPSYAGWIKKESLSKEKRGGGGGRPSPSVKLTCQKRKRREIFRNPLLYGGKKRGGETQCRSQFGDVPDGSKARIKKVNYIYQGTGNSGRKTGTGATAPRGKKRGEGGLPLLLWVGK